MSEPVRISFEELEMKLINEVHNGDIKAYVAYMDAEGIKAGFEVIPGLYEKILKRHNIIEVNDE